MLFASLQGLAADVTQDAFLDLWRSRRTYRPESRTSRSWLLSMVRHRAIDAWRRERNQHSDLHDDMSVVERFAMDDTEAEAIAGEAGRSIRGKLAELPVEQSSVIELAYFGGLTHSEIAARLGLPLGTAKARMRLGLKKLRLALGED